MNNEKRKKVKWPWIVGGFLFITMCGMVSNIDSTQSTEPQPVASIPDKPTPPPKPKTKEELAQEKALEAKKAQKAMCDSVKLVVESWGWSEEYGYVKAHGEVTNVTDEPLESVTVSVTYRTSSGELVKNSDSIIDYSPVLSGQTSPFSTIDTSNPEIKTAEISFKELFGGTFNAISREQYTETCGD